MKITLSPIERRALKAQAHVLTPVVMIGDQGLTPAVILEIERNLKAHELIKIRASTDDREARESWLHEICLALHAAPVQHIGKMLIVWRQKPPEPEKKAAPRKSDRRTGVKSGVKAGVTSRSQRKPKEKVVAGPKGKGSLKGGTGFGTRTTVRRQTRTK
ncbi:MAG: YhbY family RNA-binding protein [Betaproteobacteria bacterium]|nr:YhbY family RNA-binding protein [Betaproteobacteria bacterium]